MNILITGSGGFIGKNLLKYLEGEFNILHPRSYELDCTNFDAVQKYFKENNIDFIIHCGTVGGIRGVEDKSTTVDENLKMVDNLLKNKRKDTKMILFGSGAMYDKSRPIKKIKEDELGKCIPQDLYGKSKMLIADKIKDREDVLCLNIFACYGYGEKESRFPTYAITQNLKHQPIEINKNVVFDYLFVEDMCKIIRHFVTKGWKGKNIINITPTESIKLSEISEIVNEISDYKSEIKFKTNELGNEYTGDNARLLSEIPDFHFTSYRDGLKKFYDYLKNI